MDKYNQLKQLLLVGALGAMITVGAVAGGRTTAFAASTDTSQVTTDTHADQDKVAFTDPTLGTVVANALDVSGDVTYGDIRHYQGKQASLMNVGMSHDMPEITSLEGLQSLQELPAGIGVAVQLALATGVSLAPFSGLPVSGSFTVEQDGMHGRDFTALNDIHVLEDPTGYVKRQVNVSGLTGYANGNGLTDADVQQLKPLFSQFSKLNYKSDDGRLIVTVNNQRLTDFSFFKQFGKVKLLTTGQYEVLPKPVYIDPATFTQDTVVRLPTQIKGLDGEPVQTSTYVWSNASRTLTMDGTDALIKGVNANTKWLIVVHQYSNVNFPDIDPITYSDGSTLTTDGMQYYPVKWEKAPAESSGSSSTGTTGSGSNSQSSTSSTTESVVTAGDGDRGIAAKGSVVYAIKPIYLYQRPNFTTKDRQARYAKQPRINRPMFVVTGYAKSNGGHLRYLVKDVNHHSKTAGKTGYITANSKYTVPVYYQAKHAKITVINPQGISAYRKVSLSGKATHYRQGTVLKVVGLKHYHLTTRFKLSNGSYVTANRKLVKSGKVIMPTYIRTKTTIHRYRTADLTGKQKTYAKNTRLKVQGWTYGHADNLKIFGALRYRVAGGYVTANEKFVQVSR